MFRMFRNLKIWMKLTLIVIAFCVPLLVLLFLLETELSSDITIAQQERKGIAYLRPLNALMGFVREHERAMVIGDKAKQTEALGKIDETVKTLEAIDGQYREDLNRGVNVGVLRVKMNTLTDADQAQKMHNDFLAEVRKDIADAGMYSRLELDDDIVRYYLVGVVTSEVPQSEDYLARVGQLAEAVADRKAITPEEKTLLTMAVGVLETDVAEFKAKYDKSQKDFPMVDPNSKGFGALSAIGKPVDAYVTATLGYIDLVKTGVLNAATVDVPANKLSEARLASREARIELSQAILDSLDDQLNAQLSELRMRKWLTLASVMAIILLAIAATALIILSITRPLRKAVRVANKLAVGDLDAGIGPTSQDEPGQLLAAMCHMIEYLNERAFISDSIAAGNLNVTVEPRSPNDRFGNSFKNMLDSTLGLVQSREDRDHIQNSVRKLAAEVSNVANGDLTTEAEVASDITGPIAEAVNAMIDQLREIIHNVKDATLHVSAAANELHATTEDLANGSEAQSMQIVDTSSAIEEMVVSIQQVSENATLSSTVANQALANARQGSQSVQNTIRGMSRIRHQVQETAKRIKRLGERSQEIGEIVQLINDIADRTSILALNASIQAAMAGEAGRGFAVVAEEVERLADRSTNATKQITGLVKTIQGETNEAVAAMEDTTKEVVDGSVLANEAGQALGQIESVAHRLAEIINSISMASKQQARGSEALGASMSEISQVTQQAAAATKEAAVAVRNLVALAEELRSSVVAFKLPDGETKAVGASRK